MSDATTVLSAEITANPQKLVEGFSRADQATGAWAAAAARHMQTAQASFNGVDFQVVTSKAKAEQVKLIELQHQLDVARIAGSKQAVAALTEEIALLGKIRQLRSAGFSQTDATSAAKASLAAVAAARQAAEVQEAAAKRREKTVGDPSGALASVFARTRLGVLEEGGAKIPLFGSALEELGVAGLAAGAGLAAAALGAEEVKKSLEYADDIDRTSKALGISTTQLQEFDYAAAGSSVGISKAREALQSFNEVYGKYSAGLASGKAARFLDALGFTPETAREAGTTTEALEKTLSALSKIQNPQQRSALATQLGLKDFLVVLAEGQEGIDKFVASMKAAGGAGAVISPNEIKRGAELNDKLEQIAHSVSVEIKDAFISLGPAILFVAQLVERVAHGIADISEGFRGIAGYSRAKIGDATNEELTNRGLVYNTGLAGKVDPKTGRATGGILSFAYNTHQDNLDQLSARRATLDKLDKETKPSGSGVDLSQPKKAKRGPEDQTASLDKTAIDAYQSALKNLHTAVAALTGDIEAHAELERQAVDDELTKKLADLSKEEVTIRSSKNDAHKREQLALIEKAKIEEQNAAAAKKEKIDRDAAAALRQQDLDDAAQLSNFTQRIRSAQAILADSATRRADLELQNFKDAQDTARAAFVEQQHRLVDAHTISQEKSDQNVANSDATQRAELVAKRVTVARSTDPLYSLAHPTTSLTDDLKGVEADGLKGLTNGLADVVTGTKNVADAFKDMATSIIADLARIAIQKYIEQPLAAALFGQQNTLGNLSALGGKATFGPLGYAEGGFISGPGGPRDDKVPAMLSAGEFVVTAAAARDHGPLLSALNAGRVPRFAVGGFVGGGALAALTRVTPAALRASTALQPVVQQFDLRGAVMTEDILAHINAVGQQAAQAGAQGGKTLAVQALAGRARNRLARGV